MTLPPGFLDELRNRVAISRIIGRKVVWDVKKSTIAKGDYWAPCPFHKEKTASFHVDDKKGFYYCFGCHEKGDAISFIRAFDNVSFIEAVEIMAREAGMQMPARDPRAQEKITRQKHLSNVMEKAVQFYKKNYTTAQAITARTYIQNRGLTPAIQERFEIGFAPDVPTLLTDYLKNTGIPIEDIIETGLAIKPDNGKNPYDRFRGRIMFPIRNPRGECIAFGGRSINPNARAKYLNSNETCLFDKGRTLYNHANARIASSKANGLIVAEGYMDVIALAQYGFHHAVAPLGTAITDHQLQMIWQIHSEPVIALDGDQAGINAAFRLIDLALPLLEPEKSLRFAMMPTGQDPDDVLKSNGAAAMEALINKAEPMVNILWQRETKAQIFDTPERRATLDARIKKIIYQIKNQSLRSHYGQALAQLRKELYYNSATLDVFNKKNYIKRKQRPIVPTNETKTSFYTNTTTSEATRLRESVILTAALLNPTIAKKYEDRLENCPITTPDLKEIFNTVLTNLASNRTNTQNSWRDEFKTKLGYAPLEKLMQLKPIRNHPFLKENTDPEMIERTMIEELNKHIALYGAEVELNEAKQNLQSKPNEELTWRLREATREREKAIKADVNSDHTQLDNQKNRDKLQKMLDNQVWIKKKQ